MEDYDAIIDDVDWAAADAACTAAEMQFSQSSAAPSTPTAPPRTLAPPPPRAPPTPPSKAFDYRPVLAKCKTVRFGYVLA